jgi:hypothetical protein
MTDYVEAQDIATHMIEPGLMDGDQGRNQPILEQLVTRASRLIDNWFGYPENTFAVSVASAKYFNGSGTQIQRVGFMAEAPTEVAVAEAGLLTSLTVWSATDYMLYPYNALDEGYPYRELHIDLIGGTKSVWYAHPKAVKITAKWGWSTTPPEPIKEAVIIQASRWFKRGQQAFQDAGAVTDLMSLRYLKKLDPDVEIILQKMPGGITI